MGCGWFPLCDERWVEGCSGRRVQQDDSYRALCAFDAIVLRGLLVDPLLRAARVGALDDQISAFERPGLGELHRCAVSTGLLAGDRQLGAVELRHGLDFDLAHLAHRAL